MARITPPGLDWEFGNALVWNEVANEGAADALGGPTISAARMDMLCSYGRKWSNEISAQEWQSRWPMSEISGTVANDVIGAHNGTITGGITLNQAGLVAENQKSFLFNGTSGWINLSTNGWDLTSGDWSVFAVVKVSNATAVRGLIGGPTGAVTVSFNATGHLQVGVAGVGNIALTDYPGSQVEVGQWYFVGVSYDSVNNQFYTYSYPADPFRIGSRFHYTAAPSPGWTGSISPTAGVKSNQIGRLDAGSYFAGNMQEVLVKPAFMTHAEHRTLQVDSSSRSSDAATIVTPAAGKTGKGMQHIVSNVPSGQESQANSSRAEWKKKWHWDDYVNKTLFHKYAIFLDPATDWSNFNVTNINRGIGTAQLLGRNLQSGPLAPSIYQAGWKGNSTAGAANNGLCYALVNFGGLTNPSAGTIENYMLLDVNQGTGWNIFRNPPTASSPQRWAQMIGPNTQQGLNRPFTVGVWHLLIFEVKHTTNSGTGYIRVWHRVQGSGLDWVKTLESPAIFKTVTYNDSLGVPALSSGSAFEVLSNGMYCYQLDHSVSFFLDEYAVWSTFAEASADFNPGNVMPDFTLSGDILPQWTELIPGGGFGRPASPTNMCYSDQYGFGLNSPSRIYTKAQIWTQDPVIRRHGTYGIKCTSFHDSTNHANYADTLGMGVLGKHGPDSVTPLKEGDQEWIGWSWYFPTNYAGTGSWGNIFEFGSGTGDHPRYGSGFDVSSPNVMELIIKTGRTQNPSDETQDSGFTYNGTYHEDLPILGTGAPIPFTKGVWHDFYMNIEWQARTNGIMEIWHREGNGAWQKLYSNKNDGSALINRAPHPTWYYNRLHGTPGEGGSDPAGWFFYRMYRGNSAYDLSHDVVYWADGFFRRQNEAEILAEFGETNPGLPDLAPGHSRIGNEAGTTLTTGAGVFDKKRVFKRNIGAGQQIQIDKAYHYYRGPASGAAGVRLIVHDDDGVGGLPGALFGQSPGTPVAQGQVEGWYDISPSVAITVDGGPTGDIYIGAQYGGPGELGEGYSSVPGTGWRLDDAYSDGPTNPFGANPVVVGVEVGVVIDYVVTTSGTLIHGTDSGSGAESASVVGGFPTTSLIDNFNRANQNPLAGNYAPSGTAGNLLNAQLINNAIGGAAAGAWASYYTAQQFAADQECWVTTTTVDGTPGGHVWIDFRVTNPGATGTVDGYEVEVHRGLTPDALIIWKVVNGVATNKFQLSYPWGSGWRLGASIIGNTITIYVDKLDGNGWIQAATWTDTTAPLTSGGYIGFGGNVNAGFTAGLVDLFGGGSITNVEFVSGLETGTGLDNATGDAIVASLDTRIGTDQGDLSALVASSDAGTMSFENAAPTGLISSNDNNVSTVENASFSAVLPTVSDTGLGNDTATVIATASSSDVGTGVESSLRLSFYVVSDAGAGSDSFSLTANVTDAQGGSGIDTGAILGGQAFIADFGLGSGTEAVTQMAKGDNDSGIGSENTNLSRTFTDSATGSETASVSVNFVLSDSGSGVEISQPLVPTTVFDSSSGLDTSTLKANTPSNDQALISETIILEAFNEATDTATSTESAVKVIGQSKFDADLGLGFDAQLAFEEIIYINHKLLSARSDTPVITSAGPIH